MVFPTISGRLAILQDTDVVIWDVDQGKAIRTISLQI
jgi:hypothetical protein